MRGIWVRNVATTPTRRAGTKSLLRALIVLLGAMVLLVSCARGGGESTDPTALPATVTTTPTPTAHGATQPAVTIRPSPTRAPTRSPIATATSAPTPTLAPTPTATSEPTHAPEPTATPSPTSTGGRPVIVLDAGHDPSTGGALGVEQADTLRTALATRDVLEAAGYDVRLTRADAETILLNRADLRPWNADTMELGYVQGYVHASAAIALDADLLISLHYNGSSDPAAAGMTIYYCDAGGEQNAQFAVVVRDALVDALASVGYEPPYAVTAEDGTIGKAYGHLATLGNAYDAPFVFAGNRLVGVPAVLTEPLFETNPDERALLNDQSTYDALARGYLAAVNAWFGR